MFLLLIYSTWLTLLLHSGKNKQVCTAEVFIRVGVRFSVILYLQKNCAVTVQKYFLRFYCVSGVF